jgi:ABC-2 type transport system ATP-binding protein
MLGLAGQVAAVDELLTGRENLQLVAGLYGVAPSERRARVDEVLERFDLSGAADRRAGTYSGGMRRRLDLAATLVGRPSVMLLDEPTAGLDPRSRAELWSFVDEIAGDGTAVLLTSQHLDEIERLAGRVVVIDRGAVVADGTPDALKRAVGADVLEARVAERFAVDAASALLGDLGEGAHVDLELQRISVPTRGGVTALVTAARRLDDADIELDDLALRRPSLDDVFFALTGDAARALDLDVDLGVSHRAPVTPPLPPPSHAIADMLLVTRRYLQRAVRTPQVLFLGTIQPVVFVVMLNAVFGGLVAGARGGSYVQYLLPGVLVMNVLFGGGVTASAISEDVRDGIVDRFRSLPMSRAAVLVGRTVADLARTAIGMVLVVGVGFAMGFRVDAAGSALAALGLILLFAFSTAWLFCVLGLAVKESQAGTLISLLVSLPLVYLSGAWIPVDTMSDRLQAFARNQPVNVLIDAVRGLVAGDAVRSDVIGSVVWSLAILAVSVPVAVRQYRGQGF